MKLEFKTASLGQFQDIFTGESFERLKASILTILLRQKDLLFKNSVDPEGNSWQKLAPLSESRKIAKNKKITSDKKKQKMTKILVDTGNLKNSMSVQGASGSVQSTSGNTISIGTNVEYAAIHNFGGTIKKRNSFESKSASKMIEIPARPFLGLGIADEQQVNEKIKDFISRNAKIA